MKWQATQQNIFTEDDEKYMYIDADCTNQPP